MRAYRRHIFIAIGIVAVSAAAYLAWSKQAEPQNKPARNAVQMVKTVLAEQKPISIAIYSTGYLTAFNTVEVRPQVQNIVRAVHVREGQDVRAGQLLFTLDARSDASNLDKAKAQLARSRAELADAENALKRNQELLAKNFVSQAVVDTARSRVEALRNTVKADQAAIEANAVALGTNRITASISGRIGIVSVHQGSLAQPSGTPMVTISQIDPITVTFAVPEREFSHIKASYPKGDAPVAAQLASGEEVQGKLIFIDNTADTQSGTIRMKAQFDNAEHRLWPGMYVNVRLISRVLPDAVVIPAQAVVTGPVEKFVYLVQADDTVKMQKIEVLNIDQEQAAVSGIRAGVKVVVEGTQNLRPGVKVMEAQGPSVAAENNRGPGSHAAPK